MLDVIGPSGVAAQLARMPDVVARLLIEHVPDRRGRCRGCGFPGTGSPYVKSPCGLWLVADAARRLAQPDERQAKGLQGRCPRTPIRSVTPLDGPRRPRPGA